MSKTQSTNAETDESAHNSPQPTEGVCSRRSYLRRVGTTAGAAGAIAAGGSQLSPRYSPVGRAQAHPAVMAGVAVMAVASWYAGRPDADGKVEEYDHLEKLSIWSDAIDNAVTNHADQMMLRTLVSDLKHYKESDAYRAGVRAALREIEAGAGEDEYLEAVEKAVQEDLSSIQEGLINQFHLQQTRLTNFMMDVEALAEVDPDDLLDKGAGTSGYSGAGSFSVSTIERKDSVEVEYTLLDGSTLTKSTYEMYHSSGSSELSGHRSGSNTWPLHIEAAETDAAEREYAITASNYPDEHIDPHGFYIDGMDEDAIEEAEADGIEVPDGAQDGPFPLLEIDEWEDSYSEIQDFAESTVEEVAEFIDGIYDDLVEGDLTSEDILTSMDFGDMAADQQTFPYAAAHLASLGIPMSESTVTLEFPDVLEDGEPVRSTGNLFANPLPPSGFNVGSTYDPETLDIDIWYAYHTVDENGDQSSEVTRLEDRFTVVKAQEITDDGEVAEVDEISYSHRVPADVPTDYDDVVATSEATSDLERELDQQQREIVVELEGDSGDGLLGGGGGWPSLGDGDQWFGLALLLGVGTLIVALATDVLDNLLN